MNSKKLKITLKDYQRLQLLDEPTDLQAVGAVLGASKKVVKGLPTEEFKSVLERIISLNSNNEFMFYPYFRHKGVWYGFIPNLDKITYGENTDLVGYISDWKTMHRAMAVAYRPIKKNWLGKPMIKNGKYDIEPYENTSNADTFLDLNVEIVLGMQVFFYNLTNALVNSIPNYLAKMEKTQGKEMYSQPNGESIKNYIHSLKETSETLNQYLK